MAKNDVILLDSVIKATKEEFGDNEDMMHIYYKSQKLCPKAKLSSLPESTLKKLVNKFN